MAEWQASDYAKQSTLQQVMAEEQLARLVLKGDERILDVGCGDGKITAEIAAKVPHGSVLGTDPSRDMIAFANSHLGAPKTPNLKKKFITTTWISALVWGVTMAVIFTGWLPLPKLG